VATSVACRTLNVLPQVWARTCIRHNLITVLLQADGRPTSFRNAAMGSFRIHTEVQNFTCNKVSLDLWLGVTFMPEGIYHQTSLHYRRYRIESGDRSVGRFAPILELNRLRLRGMVTLLGDLTHSYADNTKQVLAVVYRDTMSSVVFSSRMAFEFESETGRRQ